ncbi:MAG: hypothetical protein ABL930_12090 [Pseudobdellovibrio sp.]
MKFIIAFLIACSFSNFVWAQKKVKLNPFQTNLQSCFGTQIDVLKIDNYKKLYKAIEQAYSLISSETLFREVLYKQKGELKKLKYEAGQIQIFRVDEDDNSNLISSEKIGQKTDGYELRQKSLSPEARINQLLFRADIRSDFIKIKEVRVKQLDLNIIWSDSRIKSLTALFGAGKKTLTCNQLEAVDICSCGG